MLLFQKIFMNIKSLKLKNFRSHKSSTFEFSPTTVIIGKNTAGKTNILEAIYILSGGKSFRAHHDKDTIREGTDFTSIEASVSNNSPSPIEGEGRPARNASQREAGGGEGERTEIINLKVIFSLQKGYLSKKFLVNGVGRSQFNFTSNFISSLFTPHDIELITDSPSVRRKYIDSILYQAHKNYKHAITTYERALKHRNKMLYDMREGNKSYKATDFDYFNNILIEQGSIVTSFREEFVDYVNKSKKDIFDFTFYYDKSVMSTERLFKYHFEEQAAGVTLVGPQRDDFKFYFPTSKAVANNPSPLRGEGAQGAGEGRPIQEFGSRGEERLTIFQLKVLEINYLRKTTDEQPVLLLDDIFSELDDANIHKVFDLLPEQQTIITTTHHEFVPKRILSKQDVSIIEL